MSCVVVPVATIACSVALAAIRSVVVRATMLCTGKRATIDSAAVGAVMWSLVTPVMTPCPVDPGRTIWRGSVRTAVAIACPADREETSSTTGTGKTDIAADQVPTRSGSSRRMWMSEISPSGAAARTVSGSRTGSVVTRHEGVPGATGGKPIREIAY